MQPVFLRVYHSVYPACAVCAWLRVVKPVSENVMCMNLCVWERAPALFKKVWLQHSHSLHHWRALWCLSASPRTLTASLLLVPPLLLPKCLAEGRQPYRFAHSDLLKILHTVAVSDSQPSFLFILALLVQTHLTGKKFPSSKLCIYSVTPPTNTICDAWKHPK